VRERGKSRSSLLSWKQVNKRICGNGTSSDRGGTSYDTAGRGATKTFSLLRENGLDIFHNAKEYIYESLLGEGEPVTRKEKMFNFLKTTPRARSTAKKRVSITKKRGGSR